MCNFGLVWIIFGVCIIASLVTSMLQEITIAKYEYWKEYDKGVTSNLNKQLQYNREKLKYENKERK